MHAPRDSRRPVISHPYDSSSRLDKKKDSAASLPPPTPFLSPADLSPPALPLFLLFRFLSFVFHPAALPLVFLVFLSFVFVYFPVFLYVFLSSSFPFFFYILYACSIPFMRSYSCFSLRSLSFLLLFLLFSFSPFQACCIPVMVLSFSSLSLSLAFLVFSQHFLFIFFTA